MADLDRRLQQNAAEIEQALDVLLQPGPLTGPDVPPDRLVEALRHGTLGGGKRIRPFLLRETAAMLGVAPELSIAAAVSIELIHCYSLIHDDLPAMDDDDLRRGRPTVHKAYDEATAILAGDGRLSWRRGDDYRHRRLRGSPIAAAGEAHLDAPIPFGRIRVPHQHQGLRRARFRMIAELEIRLFEKQFAALR